MGSRAFFLAWVPLLALADPPDSREPLYAGDSVSEDTSGIFSAPDPWEQPIRSGLKALEEKKFDLASHYFLLAHDGGMSRDSLKYFFAEVALQQQSWQEALKLNLAVSLEADSSLRNAATRQQEIIMRGAKASTPTASASPGPNSFVPDWNIHLQGGRREYKNLQPRMLNGEYRDLSPGDYQTGGWESFLGTSLAWNLALPGGIFLMPALHAEAGKNYYTPYGESENFFEILGYRLGAGALLALPVTGLHFAYAFDWEIDLDSSLSADRTALVPDTASHYYHSFTLEYVNSLSSFEGGGRLAYMFNQASHEELEYQLAGGKLFAGQNRVSFPWQAGLQSGVYLQDNRGLEYILLQIQYIDNPSRTDPVHYTDGSFTTPVAGYIPQFKGILSDNKDTVWSRYTLSHWSLSPYAEISRRVADFFKLGFKAEFTFTQYLDENTWAEMSSGNDSLHALLTEGLYLAQAQLDDDYYLDAYRGGAFEGSSEIFSREPVGLDVMNKKRRDWKVTLRGKMEYALNRYLELIFAGRVAKTWSNIASMPTDYRIPGWDYALAGGATFTIPLPGGRK